MAMRITTKAVHDPRELLKLLEAFDTELDAVRTLINELRTDLSAHVHDGVTTGSGDTGAGPTISAAAVVEQVEKGN